MASVGVNEKALHFSRLELGKEEARADKHDLRLPGKESPHAISDVLVGHLCEIEPGVFPEPLEHHFGGASRAVAGVIKLAGIGLAVGDEFGPGVDGQRGGHGDHLRRRVGVRFSWDRASAES